MAFVHRREVLVADGYDYADAFEMSAGEVDARSAEDVVRAGLEGAPRWLRPIVAIAHRHVLGLDLAPLSAPNHIAGWEIVDSDQDTTTLRAAGPLLGVCSWRGERRRRRPCSKRLSATARPCSRR